MAQAKTNLVTSQATAALRPPVGLNPLDLNVGYPPIQHNEHNEDQQPGQEPLSNLPRQCVVKSHARLELKIDIQTRQQAKERR